MDDLQTLWHKAQPAGDEQALAAEQLAQVTRRKSRNEFEKFRRTLFWEILSNIAFAVVCVIYVLNSVLREFPVIMGTTFLVVTGFLAWQYSFYLRLRRHSTNTDVRQHLESGLLLLKKFVLHYKIVYGVLLPICFILGFILAMEVAKTDTQMPFYELPKDPWLAWLVVVVILGIAFAAIHFQFKYLYQPKINRMQGLIDELQ